MARTFVALAAGLLLAMDASAQASSRNPHGDLVQGLDCVDCHLTDRWQPTKDLPTFDHTRQTSFPLDGRHTGLNCTSCHLDLRFDRPQVAVSDCSTCHVDVHLGNLSPDCSSCHNTVSFTDVQGLSVHAGTSFPLLGAHMQVACESCHVDDRGGAFSAVNSSCVSCHLPEYQSAQRVDHLDAGFPVTCEQCHNSLSWSGGAPFDHGSVARGFTLIGAHASTDCRGCHIMPGAALINQPASQQDCVACHRAEYQQEHPGGRFPVTCIECHNQNSWTGAAFDHNANTAFPLVGAHGQAACETCHIEPGNQLIFTPANPNDCVACHQNQFQQEHGGTGFANTCLDCHNQNTWEGATFDHNTNTDFSLVGAHVQASCDGCHVQPGNQLVFTPTNETDCVACHRSDYQSEHTGSGFATTCLECHNQNTWEGATFNHNTNTDFQLIGAHAQAPCQSCHIQPGNQLISTPASETDCIACHQNDYQSEHSGSGFSTTCMNCHTQNTWSGATFDHNATNFSLLGAHTQTPCESCHTGPNNQLLFTPANQEDCVACHQADYNSTHAGTGFPTTCLTCHNVNNWDATFESHDQQFFPIFSGTHSPGRWNNDCTTCHTGGNFQAFTCLNCHEHNQSQADRDHSEVNQYVYESNACLACHPSGRS